VDKISKLKVPFPLQSEVEDLHQFNYSEWVDMLKWEENGELNETFYMLSCIKELTTGKPG
jgi:protein tyrosine phosphatase